MKRLALLTAIVAGLLGSAWADTITLTSGKVYQGRLISQDDDQVVFEIEMYGAKMTKIFPAEEVAKVRKGPTKKAPDEKGQEKKPDSSKEEPSKDEAGEPLEVGQLPPEPDAPAIKKVDGPSFYVIPLRGVVGETFLASLLERSLKDALKRKPDVVILHIDSPGGLVPEVEKLAEVLSKHQGKLRIVAVVKDALSAAAVTALACPEIYMQPMARFGAATAYSSAGGTMQALEEKFQSAWRAQARAIAEVGGHNTLLTEAMIDRDMQLHWVIGPDGKKVIRRGQGKNMVTKRGKLLTLTPGEAEACGLSLGTVRNWQELGEAMEFGSWTELDSYGKLLSTHLQETIEKFDTDMDTLYEAYLKGFRQANEYAPWAHDGYRVWANGPRRGDFTPASQQLWKQRSMVCMRNILKAEKALKAMTKLRTLVPESVLVIKGLHDDAGLGNWKDVDRWREQLKEIRQKMYRNMKVRRPSDIQ